MSAPQFDRAKVKKAMWLAPAFAVVGLLPFIVQLDLTLLQLLVLLLAVVLVSYLLGLLFGAPGYFTLKRLGKSDSKYLIGYAVVAGGTGRYRGSRPVCVVGVRTANVDCRSSVLLPAWRSAGAGIFGVVKGLLKVYGLGVHCGPDR